MNGREVRVVEEGASGVVDPLRLARQFVSADVFRSATVDELVNEAGFHRRPLRPEDWDFIRLHAVGADTANDLCALAVNRILACVYDQAAERSSARQDRTAEKGAAEFYDPALCSLGQRLRQYLEPLTFERLAGPIESDAALSAHDLSGVLAERLTQEQTARQTVDGASVHRAGLQRFLWLQFYALERQRASAFGSALARGALPNVQKASLEALLSRVPSDQAECLSQGLNPELHAHWQFYLSSTLRLCNHGHSLVENGRLPFARAGAWMFALLHAHAFRLVHGFLRPQDLSSDALLCSVQAQLTSVSEELRARFGDRAVRELSGGFEQARRLTRMADHDRMQQLLWIRDMDQFQTLAQQIDRKIRDERIEVNRETFVEPREMCSTTHVHDDHRLVVIESGHMVFWAMPGMKLHLAPGEMTLVPRGRLHGSSVESKECVYHQPIIPDAWIATHVCQPVREVRE